MNSTVEKKCAVEVSYNGVERRFEVEPEELVKVLLQQAISAFGITQQPHLLGLFRLDGSELADAQSIEQARVKPDEVFLLRPSAVRGGVK